jgi:glycogenin glucosyltransferase
MTSSAIYTYTAAYKRFASEVKIVHFLGAVKPWHHSLSADGKLQYHTESGHLRQHVDMWWAIYTADIAPILNVQLSGLIGSAVPSFAGMSLHAGDAHRQAWEAGNIDYTGRDAFANIQKHMDESMGKK